MERRVITSYSIHYTKLYECKTILIYGDPSYYYRFGFIPAEKYNILTSNGMYHAALQVCELYAGSLNGICGRFFQDKVYELDKELTQKFNSTFPPNEKFETESQQRFLQIASMSSRIISSY